MEWVIIYWLLYKQRKYIGFTFYFDISSGNIYVELIIFSVKSSKNRKKGQQMEFYTKFFIKGKNIFLSSFNVFPRKNNFTVKLRIPV